MCDGTFTAIDVGTLTCPLAEKCKASEYPSGQLERIWPRGAWGRLICHSPEWRKEHVRRWCEARDAFCREEHRAYKRKHYAMHREEIREVVRKRYPALGDVAPDLLKQQQVPSVPPCGGDCRNCPYPECKHPAWEDLHYKRKPRSDAARNNERERQKRYRQKNREKIRQAKQDYRRRQKVARERMGIS